MISSFQLEVSRSHSLSLVTDVVVVVVDWQMFYGRGEPDWMIESQREVEPMERRGCVRQIRTRASYRSDPNVHTPAVSSTDGLMAHTRSIASPAQSNYPAATPTATRAAHVTHHSPSLRNTSTFTISIPVSYSISSNSNIQISWWNFWWHLIIFKLYVYIYDRSTWTNSTLLCCGVALITAFHSPRRQPSAWWVWNLWYFLQTVEFMVPMCCSKCEEKVREELESMEGNKLTSHDQIMQWCEFVIFMLYH